MYNSYFVTCSNVNITYYRSTSILPNTNMYIICILCTVVRIKVNIKVKNQNKIDILLKVHVICRNDILLNRYRKLYLTIIIQF